METDIMQDIIEKILHEIQVLLLKKNHLLIAIDGRCAAGKTTIAAQLQKVCECNVLHMDQFFLRPEQRTPKRFSEAGGNVDHERFLKEALIPLSRDEFFTYRPYDCHKQGFSGEVQVNPHSINIVEGTYSGYPSLWYYYDLRIFLTVDPLEQLSRIENRNGKICAVRFQERWIPLEEQYFLAYRIKERCSLCFHTGKAT